jgi:hypothetical protein
MICTIIWVIADLGGWRGKWDRWGFANKKGESFPFQVIKRIEPQTLLYYQFKTLVCLKQLMKHAFLYVSKNCILFTPFF